MAKGQKKQKQTPEVINLLEQAFSMDCTIGEACFYAGIAESTYYQWCVDDTKLSENFKRLKNKPVLKARQTVYKSLEEPKYAFEFLKKKRPDEYGDKQTINHEGNLGIAGDILYRKKKDDSK